MNYGGGGLSIPQQNVAQNGDTWVTLTPQKPVLPRSNPISDEMQGNMGVSNWQELIGIYSGFLQGGTNTNNGLLQDLIPSGVMNPTLVEHNTRNAAVVENRECFRFSAGSYMQKLGNNSPGWYRNSTPPQLPAIRNASYEASSSGRPDRDAFIASASNGTPYKSSYISNDPSGSRSWSQLEGTSPAYNSATCTIATHYNKINSNLRTNDYNVLQKSKDRFAVRHWPPNDLNSPPRSIGGVASSTTSCSQFAPMTPDQGKQLKYQQLSGTSNSLTDEGSCQRKDMQENLFISNQQKNAESDNNELLQNLVDSSSAGIGTSLTENQATCEGGHGGIDLNQTPKQKTPRRRKHRPKVVVEGKPKRTPRSTTSKDKTSIENPTGKRKYVRRKGLSASTQGNVPNEVKIPDVGSETKSCRRVLNFDLENQAEQESQDKMDSNLAEKHEDGKGPFNLNMEHREHECSAEINRVNTTSALHKEKLQGCSANPRSALHKVKQHGHSAEKELEGTKVTLTNQILAGVSSSFIPVAATTANNRTLNVLARNLSMRNPNLYHTSNLNGYSHGHEDIAGEVVDHTIIQANTTKANIDRTRQLLLQRTQVMKGVTGVHEQRGSKRAYCQTSVLPHAQADTLMSSELLHRGIFNRHEQYISGASEIWKRNKVSDISQRTLTSLPTCIPATRGCSRQMDTNGVYTSSSTSYIKGKTPDYNLENEKLNSAHQIPANQYINRHDFLEQHTSSQVNLHKEQIANKMYPPNSHVYSHNSLTALANWNLLPRIHLASRSTQEQENGTSYTNISIKKQTRGPAISKQPLSGERPLSEYQNPSKRVAGAGSLGPKKPLDLLDQIINQLRSLHIGDGGKDIKQNDQTALVPYKGDGSIIPYDSFKRRKPRPKVDLDPETNRLWNLLMGKEGSGKAEAMDKHTEKWWEEERKVFEGRVDSFIARMHLVQGDRRFSPWKGSVVDSVIGVFLTQNVSDHLSSSAFMSLAAKFPPHPTNQACCWNGANQIVEEPVQIIDPDGTITYHARIISQPVYHQSSSTSSETSEQRTEDLITGTRASPEKKNKRTKDEVISSQTSPDSFISQAIEEARSSSGSNSEAEDQIISCKSQKNKSSEFFPLQREGTSLIQDYQNHLIRNSFTGKMPEVRYQEPEDQVYYGQNARLDTGCDAYAYPSKFNLQNVKECIPSSNHGSRSDLGVQEENSFELSGKKDISSLPLTGSSISIVAGTDNPDRYNGGMAGNANHPTVQLTGTPRGQATGETRLAFLDKHAEAISNLQSVTPGGHNLPLINSNQNESSEPIQQESTYSSEPMRPAEAFPRSKAGETTTSNEPTSGTGPDISNGRKRKVEGEKTKAFDWDSLRKQVLSKSGRKERSKDAMDSLDYEALMHADVKEISHIIRERGMNNMLAERIKDFLDRLVREHERIDLEWLRDVPPDKAKDYLLSIRGLGLKSVECVRLLTLHHVAFPVDTNVGRIAVRLGWVPLQPLPESLQLHLLELYPVLESIQKYLWPRLCQLDQRTLYELHYQMITFGKVFCTKSKPNCNACPMRGECRHFASAFASARLALPGPEERSIVNSTAPIAVEEIPAPFIKPMPLTPAETNLVRETGLINCSTEPIVQEPMTPETIEVTESDIEDAFYDDPDEIPTIKLNIEEFTTNLQSFMQEHTEMQEGDLSKAIVALNPQVASIPTPKLKNVSRLRTEHQVYELPDSHPLLKGMDRRELDDPSPYLLAIWTPGETANSNEPPESKCNYQGLGQLCNERTCFSCNSIKEANSQTVRGTLLVPCRTAMRGSFPLNGTYFQVNEVFADHESSLNPIDVPRALIWNLPRRTVYFGTSVSTIFKGLTTEGIQFCFWRGFVCVRGFDQKTRAPRPLMARLHFPASKMVKTKNVENKKEARLPRE